MITIDPPSSLLLDAVPPARGAVMAVSKAALTRFLRRAQAAVGLPGEVSLLLTDDARMRELNRGFRGKRKTTDVLSFPAPLIPGLPAEFQHAGDLAISIPVAAQQAEEHGHTLDTELRVLMLHGLLHLAGMDHEADAGEMRARELELRSVLKLPSGLIERAAVAAVVKSPVKAARAAMGAEKTLRRATAKRGVRA